MKRPLATWLLFAIALAWFGFAPSAQAQTCTITTTAVAFGVYDPQATGALDGTGSVRLDCSNYGTVNVALDDGGATSYPARRMTTPSGPDLLGYQLYTDNARSIVWGDGATAATDTVNCFIGISSDGCVSTLFSLRATRTIYGRIPALQNVGIGNYSDTVRLTITF
ncbi:hypothetical protein LYSHEL_25640 [Lysobacter helvus]|uniref:Spore coat protein U/FanG domain-containing protein n=2 Tax=Lysobacteraceae TaxID=32033 RepID=A0ABN6FX65_9GAMM|nr:MULTISPECIES: spore coat U domain-containing protein [Lysobacter]BCT93540.1 hypothetical protein LYSCAS_25640 [Lysobacter caseinilyticus]BCT96693.1 hypothetical protein LYSHEL_25640 [Lysobacter helvus]